MWLQYYVSQEHIGGTTYFFTAQELQALTASSGGNTNGTMSSSSVNVSSSNHGGGGGGCSNGGGGSGAVVVNGGNSTVDNTPILALPTYNIAPPTPAHIHHLRTPTNAPHFFVQDDLKRQLLERQTLAMAQVPVDQYTGSLACIMSMFCIWNFILRGIRLDYLFQF